MKKIRRQFILAATAMLLLSGCVSMGVPEDAEEDVIMETTSVDQGNTKKAETVVMTFINQIALQNYDGILDTIYLPDGMFVSQEDIEWFLPRSSVGEIVGAGQGVNDIVVNGTSIEKTATFTVGNGTYSLVLKLGNDNKWKIVLDNLYVENWSLKIPSGCFLTVDERNVDTYYKDVSADSDYSIYTFPAIVAKPHHVTVSSNLYGKFSQDITPKTSSDTYPIVCEISDAETGNILKCIQTIWNSMYSGYIAGTDVPNIRKYFVKDYDTNSLTAILNESFPALCVNPKNKTVTYQNFYMSDIQAWKTDNYGSAILAADNAVLINFGYRIEFTDSEGNYHNCNKVTSLTMAYEEGTYRIKSLNDSTIFTYNNYTSNDF